jgi:hypothetical protein
MPKIFKKNWFDEKASELSSLINEVQESTLDNSIIERVCNALNFLRQIYLAPNYNREQALKARMEVRNIYYELLDKPHRVLPDIQRVISERNKLRRKVRKNESK